MRPPGAPALLVNLGSSLDRIRSLLGLASATLSCGEAADSATFWQSGYSPVLTGPIGDLYRRALLSRSPIILADLRDDGVVAYEQPRFANEQPIRFLALLPLGGSEPCAGYLLTLADPKPLSLNAANRLSMVALEAFHPELGHSVGQSSWELQDHMALVDQATARASLGIWQCYLDGNILRWSSGVYDLFGIERGLPLIRDRIVAHYTEPSRAAMEEARARAIETAGEFTLDAQIIRADGQERWMRLTASVQTRRGRPERLFGTKQDITKERLLIEHMRHLAETDAMTGLANRARLQARLEDPDGISALLLVDLDGFKAINDTHGHVFGDACIREVAQRLRACCGDVALVGRLGGDEFAIVLHAEHEPGFAERLARQIVEIMQLPFFYAGARAHLGASVGLAFRLDQHGEELFSEADSALYAAKAEGRGTCRIFRPVDRQSV